MQRPATNASDLLRTISEVCGVPAKGFGGLPSRRRLERQQPARGAKHHAVAHDRRRRPAGLAERHTTQHLERVAPPKDSPVNGTTATVFRPMSDS